MKKNLERKKNKLKWLIFANCSVICQSNQFNKENRLISAILDNDFYVERNDVSIKNLYFKFSHFYRNQ
jgi:hypothetical protein